MNVVDVTQLHLIIWRNNAGCVQSVLLVPPDCGVEVFCSWLELWAGGVPLDVRSTKSCLTFLGRPGRRLFRKADGGTIWTDGAGIIWTDGSCSIRSFSCSIRCCHSSLLTFGINNWILDCLPPCFMDCNMLLVSQQERGWTVQLSLTLKRKKDAD